MSIKQNEIEKTQRNKYDLCKDNNISISINYISETEAESESEPINKDISQSEEEEIIDELIKRKTSNNIHTISLGKMLRRNSKKIKNYKSKSYNKYHSIENKKSKKMKLKDWLKNNIENSEKIEEDIKDLIIEIFVARFNSYPEKDIPLSNNLLDSKKQIEFYCNKYYEFCIYLLHAIYLNFNSFFEYLTNQINFKNLSISDINKIKESLFLTGIDIKLVFKKAYERTKDFNLSSILIIMFDERLIKESKIKICKEIKGSVFYKEREKYQNYLKIVEKNIYSFEPECEFNSHKNNKISNQEDDENTDKNKAKEENEDYLRENSNKDTKKEQKGEIHKNNGEVNNENEDKQNRQGNNSGDINEVASKVGDKNKNIEKNKDNTNLIQNLNIDDLVNYINDSGKGNKKKKKKKKKSKKQEAIVKTNEDQENYIEEDLVYLNYKTTLEEYSNNLLIKEKIKPHYSEEFLKKLQILCNSI